MASVAPEDNFVGKKIDWPRNGEIVFESVTMKYRETVEPSLRALSFRIKPKQKIGIVGRTGAGKSSIL